MITIKELNERYRKSLKKFDMKANILSSMLSFYQNNKRKELYKNIQITSADEAKTSDANFDFIYNGFICNMYGYSDAIAKSTDTLLFTKRSRDLVITSDVIVELRDLNFGAHKFSRTVIYSILYQDAIDCLNNIYDNIKETVYSSLGLSKDEYDIEFHKVFNRKAMVEFNPTLLEDIVNVIEYRPFITVSFTNNYTSTILDEVYGREYYYFRHFLIPSSNSIVYNKFKDRTVYRASLFDNKKTYTVTQFLYDKYVDDTIKYNFGNLLPRYFYFNNILHNLYIVIKDKNTNMLRYILEYDHILNRLIPTLNLQEFSVLQLYINQYNSNIINSMDPDSEYLTIFHQRTDLISNRYKTIRTITNSAQKLFDKYLIETINELLYGKKEHINIHFTRSIDILEPKDLLTAKAYIHYIHGNLYLPPYSMFKSPEQEYIKYCNECYDKNGDSKAATFEIKKKGEDYETIIYVNKQFLIDYCGLKGSYRCRYDEFSFPMAACFNGELKDHPITKLLNTFNKALLLTFQYLENYFNSKYNIGLDTFRSQLQAFDERLKVLEKKHLLSKNNKDYPYASKFTNLEDILVETTYYINHSDFLLTSIKI